MAGPLFRVVAQILVAGANTFVKAFQAAYQNASAGMDNTASRVMMLENGECEFLFRTYAGGAQSAARRGAGSIIQRTEMSATQARKVLNLDAEQELAREQIIEQFRKYFEANDPNKGGSFYLQCKIYHAKSKLLKEIGEADLDEDMPGTEEEAEEVESGQEDNQKEKKEQEEYQNKR